MGRLVFALIVGGGSFSLPFSSSVRGQGTSEQGLKKELPEPLVQTGSKSGSGDTDAVNRAALHRATELAQMGDHDGAAKVVKEVAARLGASDPFVDELRGTVLTLKKDYAAAETSFRAMLGKKPQSHVAQFNIAETQFLQKRYAESERSFAALESARRESDPALADLCRFKRVVCLLAAGRNAQAEELLPKDEKVPSSPAVEYSRLAVRFAGNSRDGATEMLGHARKEHSAEVEGLYVDSFIELGWGKRDADGRFQFVVAGR